VKCNSVTRGAQYGVILDFLVEEIVFTDLVRGLKNPTISNTVKGGLEELICK